MSPLDNLNRDDIKILLEENLRLAHENQDMIRSVKRHLLVSNIFHGLKWIIIIALTVIGYLYAAPYLQDVLKQFSSLQSQFKEISNTFNAF